MNKNTYVSAGLAIVVLICLTVLGLLAGQARRSNISLSAPQPDQPVHVAPVLQAQTQPTPQAIRVWRRYYSARLGFSIEYPSDIFTALDGKSQGEPYAVSFSDENNSSQGVGSVVTVEVTPTSGPFALPGFVVSDPYSTTTLSGLPATKQYEGILSCLECETRFVLVYKGKQYMINIDQSVGLTGPDYLSVGDIEHIRQSFRLN